MKKHEDKQCQITLFLDTTSVGIEEKTIQIASEILPVIRKRYLRNIQQVYR